MIKTQFQVETKKFLIKLYDIGFDRGSVYKIDLVCLILCVVKLGGMAWYYVGV